MPSLAEILKRARQAYQRIDKSVAEQLKRRHDVKCRKGCAACCYQLVSCTFIEALVIGERLVRTTPSAELDALLERLDRDTARIRDREQYMADRLPCAFLRLDKPYCGECSVYTSRPLACRLQFVVSDPALCSPESDTTEVVMLDTRVVQLQLMRELSGDEQTLISIGPMPPLAAEAIRCIREERWPPSKLVLSEWLRRGRMIVEHDRQQLIRFGKKEHYIP